MRQGAQQQAVKAALGLPTLRKIMRRFGIRSSSIAFGCFALIVLSCQLIVAQSGPQERPRRLLQSAADIASLPSSERSDAVRAGFAPAQSSTNSGYQGSFYQRQASGDVYPYPTSNQPRTGTGSQGAFNLSQGAGGGQLSNQISNGSSTTSTGNLGNSRYTTNNGFSNSGSNGGAPGAVRNISASGRSPVEQQRSSTLNPVEQARINQVAVERLRAEQARINSNPTAQADRPSERTASRDNLFNQASGQQSTSAFRQSNRAAFQNGSASRNAAPVARCAQACTCCPQGFTPVTAGFQQGAAFQAPSLNPNVGTGLGLGVPQQQCCQPQAGFGAAGNQQGFQGTGFQQGFQPTGFQGNGFQLGAGAGVPQFGAQGARWWTPFVRGSGVYTPLLDLTPNNAGTYLGQGIIGQPTAYVNGQLLRNLLRYLAP